MIHIISYLLLNNTADKFLFLERSQNIYGINHESDINCLPFFLSICLKTRFQCLKTKINPFSTFNRSLHGKYFDRILCAVLCNNKLRLIVIILERRKLMHRQAFWSSAQEILSPSCAHTHGSFCPNIKITIIWAKYKFQPLLFLF